VTHLRQIILEELKRQDAFAGGRGFTLVLARQGFHSRRTHRSGALKTLLQDYIPTIKPDQCTISSSGTQKP
jgi:hypothetical protein